MHAGWWMWSLPGCMWRFVCSEALIASGTTESWSGYNDFCTEPSRSNEEPERNENSERAVCCPSLLNIYFIYVPSPLWREMFGYGLRFRLDLSDVPSGHVIPTNIWIVQKKYSCLQTPLYKPTWKLVKVYLNQKKKQKKIPLFCIKDILLFWTCTIAIKYHHS